MKTEFHRITRLPSYVFAEINKLKAKYRDQGHDIIDFGMGNPDIDTESFIVDKLIETVKKPKTHRYSVSCLLYTSPSPRDRQKSRMPSSA